MAVLHSPAERVQQPTAADLGIRLDGADDADYFALLRKLFYGHRTGISRDSILVKGSEVRMIPDASHRNQEFLAQLPRRDMKWWFAAIFRQWPMWKKSAFLSGMLCSSLTPSFPLTSHRIMIRAVSYQVQSNCRVVRVGVTGRHEHDLCINCEAFCIF